MPAAPLEYGRYQAPAVVAVQKTFDPDVVSRARATLLSAKNPAPAPAAAPAPVGALFPMIGSPDVPAGHSPTTGKLEAEPPPPDPVDTATTALNDALRQQRVHAIGADEPKPEKKQSIASRTERMTPADYAALTDQQRAAVDFNGLLVRAVKRDLRHQDDYEPTLEQRDTYGETLGNIFSEGKGDIRYAPETIALLKQINFKDSNADLTDFLDLNAAVKASDLTGLLDTPHVREADGAEADRIGLSNQLATGTAKLQETLAKGNALLQSINATAVTAINPDVTVLGGTPAAPKTGLGWGQPYVLDAQGQPTTELTTDGYFQRAYDNLADKGRDPKDTLADMNNLLDPQQFQQFLTYAHNRVTNAERFGVDLLHAKGVKSRTPEEFRKLLGLKGGGEDGSAS